MIEPKSKILKRIVSLLLKKPYSPEAYELIHSLQHIEDAVRSNRISYNIASSFVGAAGSVGGSSSHQERVVILNNAGLFSKFPGLSKGPHFEYDLYWKIAKELKPKEFKKWEKAVKNGEAEELQDEMDAKRLEPAWRREEANRKKEWELASKKLRA